MPDGYNWKDFEAWLEKTYGIPMAANIMATYRGKIDNNPFYVYWSTYIRPPLFTREAVTEAIQGGIAAKKNASTQSVQTAQNEFFADLTAYLNELVQAGVLTQSQALGIIEQNKAEAGGNRRIATQGEILLGVADEFGMVQEPPTPVQQLTNFSDVFSWKLKKAAESKKIANETQKDYETRKAQAEALFQSWQEQESSRALYRQHLAENFGAGGGAPGSPLAGAYGAVRGSWREEQPLPKTLKPISSIVPAYNKATEGLPYNAQRFFDIRDVQDEFELEHPGARAKWWAALHEDAPQSTAQRYRQDKEFLGKMKEMTQPFIESRPDIFGGTTEPQTTYEQLMTGITTAIPTAEKSLADLAKQVADEQAQYQAGTSPQEKTVKPRDPWETYLDEYPFMAKFLTAPRRARGFYPSTSVSRTRWFV